MFCMVSAVDLMACRPCRCTGRVTKTRASERLRSPLLVMMRHTKLFCAVLLTVVCGTPGCSLIQLDPVTADERSVVPVSAGSKTVTFVEPVVWLDAPGKLASRGVRLPPGVYRLEAENDQYLYFRAPQPIEMRVLKDGQIVDGRDIPGGLALAKGTLNPVPAVTYIDVDQNRKMHVMKHGFDFIQMRGKQWRQDE